MPTPSTGQRRLRIGLMDFEPLRVAGFESVFDGVPNIEVVPTNLAGALANHEFEMVMLGLHNPIESFELLARLKASRPKLKLVVMGSESDEETIISAIGAGAKGYLEETATPEQVMQCIEVVQSGSIGLPGESCRPLSIACCTPRRNRCFGTTLTSPNANGLC